MPVAKAAAAQSENQPPVIVYSAASAVARFAPPTIAPGTVPIALRDRATGVALYTEIDADTFPETWRGEPINAFAAALAPGEAARVLFVMQKALTKYPPSLVRNNLARVYLVGDLRFEGINAAGTNSRAFLYVKSVPDNPLYDLPFLENSFHHEFAHILRRNFSTPEDDARWAAANPPGFLYRAFSGVEAVRAGASDLRLDPEYTRTGFLCEYATTDSSEDFATVGAALFGGEPAVWAAVDQSPPLAAKFRAAIAFYRSLDSSLTEGYFRSLCFAADRVKTEPKAALPAP